MTSSADQPTAPVPHYDAEPNYEHILHIQIKTKYRLRRTEWVLAAQCLLWAVALSWPDVDVFAGKNFTVMKNIMGEEWWSLLFATIGIVRLAGLIVNGHRKTITPWLRLVCALLGAGAFTAVSLCFLSSGNISTWIAAWPVAAVLEYLNILDTASDAKRARKNG